MEMTLPALKIDIAKLKHNTELIVKLCRDNGIEIAGVTKSFAGNPVIAQALVDGGIRELADSRIENLIKLADLPVSKTLLRLPMISKVDDVVKYSDCSLNSELATIEALSTAAIKIGRVHSIILMIDLGDLREGVLIADVFPLVEDILKLKGVYLKGIGVNLNCYGGVIPQESTLATLSEIAYEIRRKFSHSIEIVSGGNTGSLHLLKSGKMPAGINHLRIGEGILLGRETSFQEPLEGLHSDVFSFITEIVELKYKPSLPFGEIGLNSFGQATIFEDKGIIKRAILACGRQDIPTDGLKINPNSNIEILGASSDHLIVNLSNSTKEYSVGDIIEFGVTYSGLLAASTSEYVTKYIYKRNNEFRNFDALYH